MLLILEEIELTRNTLAEIQALRLEVGHATGEIPYSVPQEEEVDYDSLTSRQWLDVSMYNGMPFNCILTVVQQHLNEHKTFIFLLRLMDLKQRNFSMKILHTPWPFTIAMGWCKFQFQDTNTR